jgi:hypothetical protein
MLLPLALFTLLAACTSVPLPTWTPVVPPATSAPAPGSAGPINPPPPAAVQIFPVPPPAAIEPPTTSTSPANQPAPYSEAVATRFPAPSVTYSTPGLQSARTTFSSQSEIQAWLRDQAASASRSGIKAAVLPFGKSQRGEALEALVLTRASATYPTAVLAAGRPTVLLIAEQHGDEPAGSEALLVIARELAQGLLQPTLERINVVIVPRANPDGAASNQRTTTDGMDMNRDHLLLNTPEAQALATLTRDYRPMVVVDAHEYSATGPFLEKFGAVQKFDALLQYATNADTSEFLTKASEEWYRRPLLAALKGQGLTTEWYYTTSSDPADKQVSMGDAQPDSSRNVNGLKNAVSLLIQSRGAGLGRLHLQRRVHTHVTAISSVLASTAQRTAELNQLRPYVDKAVSAQACKGETIVQAAPTEAQYDLLMLDPVSGADKTVTVDWDSALALRSLKTRARPCGYWLAAAATTAVERLRLHGVKILRIAEPGSLLGDSYRQISPKEGVRQEGREPVQGAGPTVLAQIGLTRSVVDVARGSYYVPLNQPLANLVLAALEPDTPSSYFANRIVDSLQSTVRVMVEPSLKLEELL